MSKLEEQLKELGEDFIKNMETQKEKRFPDIFILLTEMYQCREEIEKAENGKQIFDILTKFYEFGFYAAIEFMLNPDEEYVPITPIEEREQKEKQQSEQKDSMEELLNTM